MYIEKIYRAGTVPYFINEDGKIEYLFQIVSDKRWAGPDPQISKGRMDEGEAPATTALREAQEELGLAPFNIKFETLSELGIRLGRTHFFYVEVYSKDPDDFLEFEDETESTEWMTYEEFSYRGRDIHRDIVREIHQILTEDR